MVQRPYAVQDKRATEPAKLVSPFDVAGSERLKDAMQVFSFHVLISMLLVGPLQAGSVGMAFGDPVSSILTGSLHN